MEALFESYNARFVDLTTVGERFIMRDETFKILSEHNNTFLLGPRGSGKTTLLKMLKIGAQRTSPQKIYKVLKSIRYTSVYVGADRHFDLLVRGLGTRTEDYALELNSLLRALMAIRIQFALLDSLKEITDESIQNIAAVSHHYVGMTRSQERDFSKIIAKSWNLGPNLLNIMELRAELWSKIQGINAAIGALRAGKVAADLSVSFATDPLTAMASFIEAFEHTIEGRSRTWALCVDELEIMPPDLQEYFYLSLRSTDQRMLLKLATSPYTPSFESEDPGSSPMHGHDYTVINLSDRKRSESNRFVRQLVASLMIGEGLTPSTTIEMMLGKSPITDESEAGLNSAYKAPSGAHYVRFAKLRDVDPSFRQYLDTRKIDLGHLNDLAESSKAAAARKIIWPVALRLVFGSNKQYRVGDGVGMRSASTKRAPEVYTGSDAIVSMCEGNPRVTIGIFRDLIKLYEAGNRKKIPRPAQAQVVEAAIDKFLSLLSAIPAPNVDPSRENTSILELLQRIGEYFIARNFEGDFTPELVATFVVDGNIAPRLQRAIGRAVNQGAFVMVENAKGDAAFGRLPGARLRLSYLLSPYFRLPLTVSGKVNLSTALNDASLRTSRKPPTIGDLFGSDF